MTKAKHHGGKFAVILLLVAVVLLAGAFFVLRSLYVRLDGEFIRRDTAEHTLSTVDMNALLKLENPTLLDLRGAALNPEDYDILAEAFPDCRIRWSVPLSSGAYDNEGEALSLPSYAAGDAELLRYFPNLKTIGAEGLDNWQDLRALDAALPDCDVSWTVPLDGEHILPNVTTLSLSANVSAQELEEKLVCFPALTEVTVAGDGLSTEEKLSVKTAHPDIHFNWDINYGGKTYKSGETAIDLSGSSVDLQELLRVAPLFDGVSTLDMSGCGFTNEQMRAVMDAFPNAEVLWDFSIYGVNVTSLDEEVDLSGIQIADTSEIENALPFMPRLKKVIMSDCGIGDEDMDALNKRHEDVRFVWTVYFGKMINDQMYSLRTDTDHFISSLHFGFESDRQDLNDETVQPLKYCTDIVALDLGHQHFTNLDFIRDMKKLRYLITADGNVEDISVLTELPELYFAELFLCPIKDFSPLLECENLRHLNICHCWPEDMEVIKQLDQLERLWFMSAALTYQDIIDIREALPDVELQLGMQGTATGGTWRYVDAYYEMRDILGAYYMAGGTEAPKE
ncbi:MAG: hypothetical protein E7442_03425 [Ruminococcaceae bacterium]|nr:hypothetical protein [Oscillospiraceae bacterium]